MSDALAQISGQAVTADLVKTSLEFFQENLRQKFEQHFKSKEIVDRNGVVTKPFILKPPGVNTLNSSFSESKKLKSIRPKHLKILNLYLSGKFSHSEIAKIMSVSPAFVSMTINSIPGQRIISDSYEAALGEFKALTNQAVGAFREGLNSEVPAIRLKTATDFFKLAQKQAPQRIQLEVTERTVDIKEKLFNKLGLDPEKLIELTRENYS